MLKASTVIEEGKQAYRDGLSQNDCPYDPPTEPCVEEGFHGSRSIGPVRVRINFRWCWIIGWHIAEKYEAKPELVGT